jgi:hypothetical protein
MPSVTARSIATSRQWDAPQGVRPEHVPAPRAVRSLAADTKVRQLRRSPRARVDLAVRIADQRGDLSGRMIDISRTGAGIAVSHAYLPGDSLRLELNSGRMIDASVRWSAPGRLGVRFVETLASEDPLLAGLDAVAPALQKLTVNKAVLSSRASSPPSLAAVIARMATRHGRAFRASYRDLLDWRQVRLAQRVARRDSKMIERACREQGSGWLVDI